MPRPLDLPPLRHWQDFEDLCLDLWRRLWKDPDAQKHGRQGQPQAGVDVYGREGGQWVGVQCKRLEGDLTPKVIEEEVEKARTFEPPLSRFVLAATARSDIHCQKAARKITESGFPVTVVSWDEICHHLEDHPDLLEKYFGISRPDPKRIDPPPAGYRCMAVPPEKGFVEREELEQIRTILCGDGTAAVGITSALRGAGGFGKTTLAQALCQDARVRAAYPDGILWTTIGDQATPADRLSRVLDLIRWWTRADPPHFDTVTPAAARLREILTGQRVLVVVDDAWTAADVEPFRGAGAGLLVTSRHHEALTDCVCTDVDAMRLGEAVKLLMADLPGAEGLRPRFEDLARALGEWPLLLKLVNGTLQRWIQRGLGIEKALAEVAQAGLESFDRRDSTAREKAVSRTMEVSLRHLSEEERRRYEALAIFPEDENVPLQILERLWSCSAVEVRHLSLLLHGLSLLRDLDLGTGTLRLHDVFRKYLIGRQGSAIAALHQDFLAWNRPATGLWADLSESYLWRWLPYHLMHAGQRDTLRDLLLDIRFLSARLQATDVNVVIAGFDYLPGDSVLRLVQSAIRMSAHILVCHPEQLAGQLLGRLPERSEDGEFPGWEQVRQDSGAAGKFLSGGAGILPRRTSLTPAGGPLLRIFEGHTGPVTAVVVGIDRALSSADDGTLRLWDLGTGACLHTLAYTDWVTAVGMVGTNQALSGSDKGTLRLWDLGTGACLHTLEGHRGWITAVAVVGADRVLSGSGDRTLRLWDLRKGACLCAFEGHTGWVSAVTAIGIDRALSGSDDGMVRLWDLGTGSCLRALEGHAGPVTSVAAVGTDRALSGSGDRTLRLWNLETGSCLRTFEGHTGRITAVAVVGDDWALSGSDDGAVRLWDLETGSCLRTFEGHTGRVTMVAAVGADRALSGSGDWTLRLWDLRAGSCLRPLGGHSGRVTAVAAVGSDRALSGSDDGTLRLWNLERGSCLRTLEGHTGCVTAVATVGSERALSGSDNGMLRLWDLGMGACLRTFGGAISWGAVDWASLADTSEQALHSLEAGTDLHTLIRHIRPVTAMAAVGADQALSGSDDGAVRLWDLETGTCLRAFEGHTGRVWAVGSDRALSGADDGAVRLWDLRTGACLHTFEGHAGGVWAAVAVGADRVLSGSHDRRLRLWDLGTGACLRTFEGHTGWINAVAAVGEGRALSGSSDKTLRLWDLDTGTCLAVFTFDQALTAVAVSNGIVIVGDRGGNVHFLDLILPDSL